MKTFRQWMKDKLFDLLSWLSPTEQPTPDELRAWAREEVQKSPQPQIWFDPTIRSYPQQEPLQQRTDPLHLPPGTLARGWHEVAQSGKHPTISQALKRIRMQPVVRTNTPPLEPEKDFPAFLNDKEDTLQVPAYKMQAFHQERSAS